MPACQVALLFLNFNRPAHTKAVLERIRMAQPPRLYLHCDGPRADRPEEADQVAAVRAILQKGVDWPCQVLTLYRDRNLGLREGVFDAINWFFRHEPYGIILEDDCVPDPSLFRFCEELLIRYAEEPQIMHIGCSNLMEEPSRDLPASWAFSRFSLVWAWAGWRRAWEKMSLELAGLDEFERQGEIKKLLPDPKAQRYMLEKFHTTQRRENNSWAYAWFYSILKNNGLCIIPQVNLVQNVGVGEAGATHTTGRNEPAKRPAQPISFPLQAPVNYSPEPTLEQAVFYATQKSRFRLWLWFILHQLGRR
ncbi:MAG: hypothetical protein ABIQ93_08425 [Saprospiraceae bacterium]